MALEIVRNDDFIEYFLFPTIDHVSEIEEDATLDELLKQINELASSYSNYIWHKDPFNLKARNRNSHLLNPDKKGESYPQISIQIINIWFTASDQLPAHLYGISYFGDNIQDEFFIVYLLIHLSREVSGLIIRCCDSDGEFLLIEAAEHLPQWANPETCEQRVSVQYFLLFRFMINNRKFNQSA